MSETDDTDVLLLIPPKFFLVCSSESEDSLLESSRTVVHKPVSCTARVLGKLVDQVHSLESRLDTLEINTTTTSSAISNKNWNESYKSFDRKCSTFPRRRRRKVFKRDNPDFSLISYDFVSTHENIPTLNLKGTVKHSNREVINDSQSMDGDISSILSTPSKTNDKLLLNEIDEFLTKVEAYESPETKCKVTDKYSPENVIKATGNYITQQLESNNEIQLPSGRKVTSEVLDKYIYLVKNNALPDKINKNNPEQDNSENSNSTQIKQNAQTHLKSSSMRKLNFSENKDTQSTSTPKKYPYGSSHSENFKPSTNKIYEQASKVLDQYRSKSYSHNTPSSVTDTNDYLSEKGEFKMPQMRPFNSAKEKFAGLHMDSIDTDLLSLSELWGEKGEKLERAESLKLEEERLKREHCEVMIQQLQRKILEQQEKLAVAIKVDRGKDIAINKLREAWLRLTHSLDRAEERHRAALEKMVKEVDNFKMVADDAQKKTQHFEAELYKALDLAHDYQEKCKQLTQEKKELQENTERSLLERDEMLKSKEREVEVLKDNCDTIMRLNKQSADCVKNLEDALEKERTEHEECKSKVDSLSHKIQSVQEESYLVIQEKDILKEKVNEERSRCNVVERQLCDVQNQNSELMKKCETLESEIKTLQKHLELQKNELKTHYQRQLEDAVLGKLKEFQVQLDQAQSEMEAETRSKENAIIDTYNAQIARIEEQHKLEVNVLEEKQKEEIKLYRLQLAQASEKIGFLENKLETYRRRRGQIASQLHSVMEAQWRQALQILTNGQPASQPANQIPNQLANQACQPTVACEQAQS
ncbi:putative leucine-rich repeat-containing protein DDB_G0290503 isoform X2 [Battus philenor]|uniref:putative leucine-rich repeat-containing protein DDB_G0290503 isoform X2 n=1 Tax=Battus philenor TaxID=42288 RepID=UPI0035CF285C